MAFVKCKECIGCEKRTPYSACRETCEDFKIAEAKAQKKEQADREYHEYIAYISSAVPRMKSRRYRYRRGRR